MHFLGHNSISQPFKKNNFKHLRFESNVKEKNILIRYLSNDAITFIILCNVTQQCYNAVLSQLNFSLTRY